MGRNGNQQVTIVQVLNNDLPFRDFEDFANQNTEIEAICQIFSQARADFYQKRVPLWRELKSLLQHEHISNKSINKNGILIKGQEITSLVLSEAIEYFTRAFCNFYAQDELIQHGYSTWSEITNYYSSFFSIHSLLRLQGRCITRLWRPGGKQFYIFPYSFKDHEYVISTKGVKGKSAHEAAWSLYYDVYDSFSYAENVNFETIFKKKYVGTPEEEIDFRNKVNYEPYQGYEEIWDPKRIPDLIACYEQKRFTNNEVELLSRLATDPEYQYYARSALRILFSHSIFSRIAQRNRDLNLLLHDRRSALTGFLTTVKPRVGDDTLCRRIQILLGLGDT